MTATWHSTQIYYYDTSHDHLSLDAVRPALRALAGHIDAAYVVPHWRQGPHLRVNVRCHPDAWTRHVKPEIAARIGAYLAEHPSTAALGPRAPREHARLAQLELEDGPLTPYIDDNTITFQPYDPRLHIFGTIESSSLHADFHADATDLVWRIQDQCRDRQADRFTIALELMWTTSHIVFPPIQRSAASYYSHSRAFISNSPDPTARTNEYAVRYAANKDALAGRLRTLLDAVDGTGTPNPLIRDWAELLRRYKNRVTELLPSGRLPITDGDLPRSTAPLRPVPLISELAAERHMRQFRETVDYQRYRLLLNYTYGLLTRLRIRPIERGLLCHLAAATVEDAFDVDIAARFRDFLAHPHPLEGSQR
ncbi:thiopeptide maturation pyridine synthase [Actinomadura oligospora]|uniref:thiopeptide maturation pyridine synthase n=1 Tax=Actinomadura oligospora TaxID=111804 RepID=UPI000478D6F0|nr:thiopeptide maturation pyridine synthase [Actinomadura oligospora]